MKGGPGTTRVRFGSRAPDECHRDPRLCHRVRRRSHCRCNRPHAGGLTQRRGLGLFPGGARCGVPERTGPARSRGQPEPPEPSSPRRLVPGAWPRAARRCLVVEPGRLAWQDVVRAVLPQGGQVAVPGGRRVFDLFLAIGYDAFHLSRVTGLRIPGGIAVFSACDDGQDAEAVLSGAGLRPGPSRILDQDGPVILSVWRPHRAGGLGPRRWNP